MICDRRTESSAYIVIDGTRKTVTQRSIGHSAHTEKTGEIEGRGRELYTQKWGKER
jgi:hypothetical protein